mmetsp:Transcript_15483/g.36857  ORF Transcript_15483/g.36857 Transcript_15483/m.36857 type:complete len:505 (+) Transcript_15483:1870-3384(+)
MNDWPLMKPVWKTRSIRSHSSAKKYSARWLGLSPRCRRVTWPGTIISRLWYSSFQMPASWHASRTCRRPSSSLLVCTRQCTVSRSLACSSATVRNRPTADVASVTSTCLLLRGCGWGAGREATSNLKLLATLLTSVSGSLFLVVPSSVAFEPLLSVLLVAPSLCPEKGAMGSMTPSCSRLATSCPAKASSEGLSNIDEGGMSMPVIRRTCSLNSVMPIESRPRSSSLPTGDGRSSPPTTEWATDARESARAVLPVSLVDEGRNGSVGDVGCTDEARVSVEERKLEGVRVEGVRVERDRVEASVRTDGQGALRGVDLAVLTTVSAGAAAVQRSSHHMTPPLPLARLLWSICLALLRCILPEVVLGSTRGLSSQICCTGRPTFMLAARATSCAIVRSTASLSPWRSVVHASIDTNRPNPPKCRLLALLLLLPAFAMVSALTSSGRSSHAMPMPSPCSLSTGKAAQQPGRTTSHLASMASSMSCGMYLRPLTMIMSLARPAMKSSPL